MRMTDTVERAEVVAIAQALSEHYGIPFSDGRFSGGQLTVIEGSHEGSSASWIISWEEGPHEWTVEDLPMIEETVDRLSSGELHAEPLNHFALAFYLN